MLQNAGIRPVPLTAKNPQSNALCERLHLTIGNILRANTHFHAPENLEDATVIVDSALQTAAYSVRAAKHSALGMSPGALVFRRDMLLDIPFVADWIAIREKIKIACNYL